MFTAGFQELDLAKRDVTSAINALLQRLKLAPLKPYNKAFGAHYGIWSEKRLVRYMSTSVGHVNENPFKPLISIDYLASMPGAGHGGSRAFNAPHKVIGGHYLYAGAQH